MSQSADPLPVNCHRRSASDGNTVRFYPSIVGSIALLLLGSCTTMPHGSVITPASDLPPDVALNLGAGQGMFLLVKLRLEKGEECACVLDTGAPGTRLPLSLEPALGQRLATRKFSTLDAGPFTEHIHAAPKLYLGNVPLVTGNRVGVSEDPAVLGMDCLRHYCIQLDFQAGKMRFLRPEQLDPEELGKAFALTASRVAMVKQPAFFGRKDSQLLIDTGCALDGYLRPTVFKQVVRAHHAQILPMLGGTVAEGKRPEIVRVPRCVWGGETYTNLIIGKGPNLVGLRFLARHLVTLNFPGGTMYLERTSGGVSDGLSDAKRVSGEPQPP